MVGLGVSRHGLNLYPGSPVACPGLFRDSWFVHMDQYKTITTSLNSIEKSKNLILHHTFMYILYECYVLFSSTSCLGWYLSSQKWFAERSSSINDHSVQSGRRRFRDLTGRIYNSWPILVPER